MNPDSGNENDTLLQEVNMTVFKQLVSMVLVFCFFLAFGPEVVSAQKQSDKPVLININTASVEQLSSLPRIGEKIARRIVDFRKKNGKFKRIEDLMKVSGVGEKVFVKLKERITV